MEQNNNSCGPGGIVWSHADVATDIEIVEAFEAIEWPYRGNWGTGATRMIDSQWNVTDETYINGLMLTFDFDYRMGYLIMAVDRTSSVCTYIAIVFHHGRGPDGTFQKDWMVYPHTHKFFEIDQEFHTAVHHWAVDAVLEMVDSHDEALREARR